MDLTQRYHNDIAIVRIHATTRKTNLTNVMPELGGALCQQQRRRIPGSVNDRNQHTGKM